LLFLAERKPLSPSTSASIRYWLQKRCQVLWFLSDVHKQIQLACNRLFNHVRGSTGSQCIAASMLTHINSSNFSEIRFSATRNYGGFKYSSVITAEILN